MAKFKKKKDGDLPQPSTAALPDIVFMLLFFFMTVTQMKNSDIMVADKLPSADTVERLNKKNDRVIYIHAGKPKDRYRKKHGEEAKIQLNDKLTDVSAVKEFVINEVSQRPEDVQKLMMTALKIGNDTNMGIVTDIKEELREVNMLKIVYIAAKPGKDK